MDDSRRPSRSHRPFRSLSPLDPPSSAPSLPPGPNGAAATDELPRGHRHPLASPMRSKAPPRPPLPPHRSTALRKPWMLPASPFPSSATADRRRQIRPRPASLKLAVHLYRVYVSSPSVSPSLFRRSRAVARLSTAAESFSPLAMAWPWPQPPQLAPEPTVVLTATPGGRSALPFPLLCTVAPFPPTPEVRQPLSSTPARITAALASPVCPVRCARARAFRRCPPPAIWSPEQETRRPPPPRPRRRLNAGGIESFDQGFDLPWVYDRWAPAIR